MEAASPCARRLAAPQRLLLGAPKQQPEPESRGGGGGCKAGRTKKLSIAAQAEATVEAGQWNLLSSALLDWPYTNGAQPGSRICACTAE
ncbi:Hypothetical predicted protein [Podarcis lilfordi]|uniref:Uncharacterized protein n=1 Tax=Podarcis lilfordi TaxID=74358 RepID=A0AA35KWA3_9SAUR|nr:Hypothetical predicted protein [Podarcis lilfordi]